VAGSRETIARYPWSAADVVDGRGIFGRRRIARAPIFGSIFVSAVVTADIGGVVDRYFLRAAPRCAMPGGLMIAASCVPPTCQAIQMLARELRELLEHRQLRLQKAPLSDLDDLNDEITHVGKRLIRRETSFGTPAATTTGHLNLLEIYRLRTS
jgi:hypothetical protein